MFSKDFIMKVARFGVVGLLVMVVNMGLNALFGSALHLGKQPAFILSYVLSLCLHFYLNKRWTFGSTAASSAKQVREYLLMVVVTFVIQWTVFTGLITRFPALPGSLAAGVAIVAQMAVSFVFMQTRVFGAARPKERPEGHARSYEWAVTGVLCVGVIALYAWIICPTAEGWHQPSHSTDYYNLEVHGLLKGHLYMDVDMPKNLPPWEEGVLPPGAPFLLDASYYHHHYYLYFGIAPLLTFFLPFRLLSGSDLSPQVVVLLQASLGFLVLVAAFRELRRRFFPRASTLLWGLVVVALGLTTSMPPTIRRSLMYEVSTTASFMFGAGLLWGVLRADASRRPKAWLAFASLCGGLAFASRPNAGFAAALVLPFVAHWFYRKRAGTALIPWYLACGVPAGLCLSLVLGFNYARFGGFGNFGHAYQMGSDARTYFSVRYVLHNLQVYYLNPPSLSWYFPFVAPGLEGAKPVGYIGLEEASGQWFFVPFVAIGLIVWLVLKPRQVAEPIRLFCWTAGLWFSVNFLVLCVIAARANRYLLDCHGGLVALACVGILALSGRSGGRRWVGTAAGIWVILCSAHNVLESCETESFFVNLYPEVEGPLASAANRLMAPLQAALGKPTGIQAFDITFVSERPGRVDPLLFSGWPNHMDTLELRQLSPNSAQMWYVHYPDGGVLGRPFIFTPGATRRMVVEEGSFFPPLHHPSYGDMPLWEQIYLRSHVKVTLDGTTVLEGDAPSYEGGPRFDYLGRKGDLQLTEEVFMGSLNAVGPVPYDRKALDARKFARGAQAVTAFLPRDRFGYTEPLVCVGMPRAYNLVGVEYTDPGHVRFFFQEAGAENAYTPVLPIDYLKAQTIETYFAGLDHDREGGEVVRDAVEFWLNGRRVATLTHLQQSPAAGALFIGAKPWAEGDCRKVFGGAVLGSVRREPPDGHWDAFRASGQWEATIVFPPTHGGQSEPLLVLGKTGDADGLFVQYLGPHTLRFGMDRWNKAMTLSQPLEFDPDLKHALKVTYGPWLPKGSEGRDAWTVWFDGKKAFVVDKVTGPAVEPLRLGRNEIGMSTMQAAFSGRFEASSP